MRSLVVIAALAGCSGILFAQTAPVKMGLWEKKMTMDMGNGTPRKIAAKKLYHPRDLAGNGREYVQAAGRLHGRQCEERSRLYLYRHLQDIRRKHDGDERERDGPGL